MFKNQEKNVIYTNEDYEIYIYELTKTVIFTCSEDVDKTYAKKFNSRDGKRETHGKKIHWIFEKSNTKAIDALSKIIQEPIEKLFTLKECELPNVSPKSKLEERLSKAEVVVTKKHVRKMVWTNPDNDKFLFDYTEKSFVFFANQDFTSDYEEFSDRDLCFANKYSYTELDYPKKEGFCFQKFSSKAVNFINRIMNDDNDDEPIDIRNLMEIKVYDKKQAPPKETQPKTTSKFAEQDIGIPIIRTAMDVFYELNNIMERKIDKTSTEIFIELTGMMEQKVNHLKQKELPDGSYCIFGENKKVIEEIGNITENGKYEIKTSLVIEDNRVVILNKIIKSISLKIKDVDDDTKTLFGPIEEVNEKILELAEEDDNNDIYNVKYEYEIGGNKMCILEKE